MRITLHGKSDFTDAIRLKDLEIGIFLGGLSVKGLNIFICVLLRRKQIEIKDRRGGRRCSVEIKSDARKGSCAKACS